MSGHWCACGIEDGQHEEDCYYGEDGVHSHWPPLCCRDCPCLSFEEAHPEEVGTLIGARLPTRVKTILAQHQIFTMERLDQRQVETRSVKGIGPTARWQIYAACMDWHKDIASGAVTPKPLPEYEPVK